jgi:hypothetical protein
MGVFGVREVQGIPSANRRHLGLIFSKNKGAITIIGGGDLSRCHRAADALVTCPTSLLEEVHFGAP